MEPLEELRARIANFPGYNGEIERRLSDEYVRAYLGEALAGLAARCSLPAEMQERIDALLLRVEFADQRDFATHPNAQEKGDGIDDGAVAAKDAAVIDLADRAASVDADSASGYLESVTKVLDERDVAMRAAAGT
jgi:hypothetical protein